MLNLLTQEYQETEIERLTAEVRHNPGPRNWMKLAQITLSRLITFNKRRGNAAAQMLVEKFKKRPDWKKGNTEIMSTLNPIEKQLMKRCVSKSRKGLYLIDRNPKVDFVWSSTDNCWCIFVQNGSGGSYWQKEQENSSAHRSCSQDCNGASVEKKSSSWYRGFQSIHVC